MNTKQLVSQ
uniref:Uncharacterized protein n=1 Tax=Anguilla anguilla TaxID=7936 RepID=A0A0E9W361_ANGAN